MYNIQTKMTTEDRITRSRTQCMKHEKFMAMASVMMIGTWEVCDKTPTAYTTGKKTVFGRKFVDALNDPQTRWLILHEYFHVMLKHMIVWKHLWDEDAELANVSADIVINNWLDNTAGPKNGGFLEMPPGGCLDHQYDGMDTGEVFRKLKQQNQGKGKGKSGQPGQGQPGQPGGFDEHDFQGSGDDDGEDGAGSPTDKLTEKEMETFSKMIDEAIRQGAHLAGKIGGNVSREFAELLEVAVPWEDQLRDFVSTQTKGNDMATWRRPSRRWMTRDIRMPAHISENINRITIGIDTSGSISQRDLTRFLTEVKGACEAVNPDIVDIIYWDYEVAGHEEYEHVSVDQIVSQTRPRGGGGTRIGSMKEYMLKKNIKPDCILVFTDGYVEHDWGGNPWPAPVMFCITTKGITAPLGKSLHVPLL